MIDPEKVLSRLKIMTDIDLEREEQTLLLCSDAASQLNTKLRSPLYGDDPRVISAAAALALVKKTGFDTLSSVGISSFKAGDVTVNMNTNSKEVTQMLLKEALAAAADLLTDSEFLFMEV